MGTKHHFHTSAPIPPHLPPSSIIAALHDHNTALTLQALTVGHERLPSPSPATLKDTYWYPVDLHPVTAYSVTEVVAIMPGVRKQITFPSCFQNTAHGVRTRADTSGVVLRAEFRVIPADDDAAGAGNWLLVEDVEVACAWWMMPLVRSKMEEAHRDICRKVVDKVEGLQRGGAAVQVAVPEGPEDELGPAPLGGLQSVDVGLPPPVVPGKVTYG